MALQMNITLPQPAVTVPNAYVRVEQVLNNRFEDGMACVARCYQANPSFPPTMPAFKDIAFRVPFDPNGGDPYEQAYKGAKALPEFAGAIDV